jgi:hypothetical protein
MSRILRPTAGLAALAGAVLLAAAALVPEHRLGLADAGLQVVGALGLVAALRILVGAIPPAPRTPARPPAAASRPAGLERLERRLLFAEASGLDAHRLRLALREVAADRLAGHHAIDLDADPAAARAVLGPELWAAVGPPPARPDRDAPRLGPGELARLLDALERT